MGVQEDMAWFNQNRAFIVQQYQGQFVLIRDQAVRGAYPTFQAAYDAGVQQFGAGSFVVKEALPEHLEYA